MRWCASSTPAAAPTVGFILSRRDNFFELGGTSLSALRLAIALDRAVSFRDVGEHPILADQAALLDARGVPVTLALAPNVRCAATEGAR